MPESKDDNSIDIAGFGKIAKAIPASVYEKSSDVLLQTFSDLTAPLTATTAGLGRYLAQKFDNMVEAEKAIATFTVEKAISRAAARIGIAGQPHLSLSNVKPLIRSIEEAARETDPLLHEMWTNLIASQLCASETHPHFVELLSHFSQGEALMLLDVVPIDEVGENGGGYISMGDLDFESWIPKAGAEPKPWTISCTLLYDMRLVSGLGIKDDFSNRCTILYLTKLGSAFLHAVMQSAEKVA